MFSFVSFSMFLRWILLNGVLCGIKINCFCFFIIMLVVCLSKLFDVFIVIVDIEFVLYG